MGYEVEKEFEGYAALVRRQESLSQKRDYQMASEFLQAVNSVKTAIDGFKLLSQYGSDIKDMEKRGEFMRIIGQLKVELAEAQIELANQMTEKFELQERVRELEDEIDKLQSPDNKPVLKGELYYKRSGDGPYCTACFDSRGKWIRLPEAPQMVANMMKIKYRCPECRSLYK